MSNNNSSDDDVDECSSPYDTYDFGETMELVKLVKDLEGGTTLDELVDENYAYLEDYFERRRRERQRKNVTREELRSALAKIQAVMVGTVNTGCKESGNKLKLPGESSGESSSLCSVTPLTSGTSSTPSSGPSTSSAWVGSPKASGPRSSFKPPKPIFETGESQECEDYQEPKKPKRGDADSSEPSTPRGGGGRPITVTATIELPPHNRKSSSEDEDSL